MCVLQCTHSVAFQKIWVRQLDGDGESGRMKDNFSHTSSANRVYDRLRCTFSFCSHQRLGSGQAAVVGAGEEIELREIMLLLRGQHQGQGRLFF